MIQEIDKRNFAAFNNNIEDRANFLSEIIKTKSDDVVFGSLEAGLLPEINTWTGNTRFIKSVEPMYQEGSLIERAINYLHGQKESFGFQQKEIVEYMPDSHITETSSGLKAVNVYQYYKGIPIFLVSRTVVFNKGDGLESAVGDSVSIYESIDINPKVTVIEAINKAIEYLVSSIEAPGNDWLGEPLQSPFKVKEPFVAKKLVEFPELTCQPTVLDKSILADFIRANLVIFYIGPTAVVAWKFTITLDTEGQQYDVVISANDPNAVEILYLKKVSVHTEPIGLVFKRNGAQLKEWVNFSPKITNYPIPDNKAHPKFNHWVDKDETKGPNVVALQGNTMASIKGVINGLNQLRFETNKDQEQQVINMFYYCNYLHDFFYLLGFDTVAGSFDKEDPVIVKAYNHAIQGTANMTTPVDGSSPTLNLGLVTHTGRHTALDADVVFHEYAHGVTNRLVGGRMNDRSLQEDQSRAMGEGWSDYFALSISNFFTQNEKFVIGNWVTDSNSGIRSRLYDDHYDTYLTYGKIRNVPGEHQRGELWCATLLHWTRHLSNSIGKDKAYYICWQSIIDGLKLTNANPSFIDARNAILRALESLGETTTITANDKNSAISNFWKSFAKFGMGTKAQSNGPWLNNIIENFDTE